MEEEEGSVGVSWRKRWEMGYALPGLLMRSVITPPVPPIEECPPVLLLV